MASIPVAAVSARGLPSVSDGVEHRHVGDQRRGIDAALFGAFDGDDRDGSRFRAGAGGCRHQRQRQAPAPRKSDAPDAVELVARTEQISGELGHIHRAAAAEPDDRMDARRPLPGRNRRQQRRRDWDRPRPRRTGRRRGLLLAVRPAAGRAGPSAVTAWSVTSSTGPPAAVPASSGVRPCPIIRRGPGWRIVAVGHLAAVAAQRGAFQMRSRSSRPISARAGLGTGWSLSCSSSRRRHPLVKVDARRNQRLGGGGKLLDHLRSLAPAWPSRRSGRRPHAALSSPVSTARWVSSQAMMCISRVVTLSDSQAKPTRTKGSSAVAVGPAGSVEIGPRLVGQQHRLGIKAFHQARRDAAACRCNVGCRRCPSYAATISAGFSERKAAAAFWLRSVPLRDIGTLTQ